MHAKFVPLFMKCKNHYITAVLISKGTHSLETGLFGFELKDFQTKCFKSFKIAISPEECNPVYVFIHTALHKLNTHALIPSCFKCLSSPEIGLYFPLAQFKIFTCMQGK